MALKPCFECGKEMSTTAKSCANCGALPKKRTSVLTWAIGGFVMLAILINVFKGADSPGPGPAVSKAAPPAAHAAPSAPPAAPRMSESERLAAKAEALKGFDLERDNVEKISFYTPKGMKIYKDHLALYIAVPDQGRPILRVMVAYHGDSWIFWNSMKIMADDVVVYARDMGHIVKRDNNTAGVFESVDFPAADNDAVLLRVVSMAKSATMRLSGNDKREDYALSKTTLANLKKSLDAYDALAKISKQ